MDFINSWLGVSYKRMLTNHCLIETGVYTGEILDLSLSGIFLN